MQHRRTRRPSSFPAAQGPRRPAAQGQQRPAARAPSAEAHGFAVLAMMHQSPRRRVGSTSRRAAESAPHQSPRPRVGSTSRRAAESAPHQSPRRRVGSTSRGVASWVYMRDAQTGKRPTVREIPSPCRTCACAGRQAESWDMLQGAVRCASRQQGDIESARLSHFKYRNTAVWCAVRERASPYYYRLCLAQEASPT